MAGNFAAGIDGCGYGLCGIWQLEGHDGAMMPPQEALPTTATRVRVPSCDLAALVDSHWRRTASVWYIKQHNAAVPLPQETMRLSACVGIVSGDFTSAVYRGRTGTSRRGHIEGDDLRHVWWLLPKFGQIPMACVSS